VHCVPIGAAFCLVGQQPNMLGVCQTLCPAGQTAFPVNRCCVNGTSVNALGQCPGVIVPPEWYLDYLATGTGPCLLPDGNCSYYEFTITGRRSFGRGSLTQRITLPQGASFPEVRVVRGSRYCPASNWSCSKSGNVFTCTAEDCGLEPGDQVVLRTEGRVAPNLTQPPPQTLEETACGVLEWQALPGRGPVTIAQRSDLFAPMAEQRQQGPSDGGVIDQLRSRPLKEACWTIRVLGRTSTPSQAVTSPTCPANYAATADGQCCLSRQLTATGQCCPAGMRPDAARRTCVPIAPACEPAQKLANGACCPPGTLPNNRRMTCDAVTPPPGQCERSQRLSSGDCCPAGTRPDAGRRTCVPVTPPCEPSQRLNNGVCCPAGTQPNNRRLTCEPVTPPRQCGPDQSGIYPNCCPLGQRWDGKRCVSVSTERCPADSIGSPPNCRCRPPLVGRPGSCTRPTCPDGMTGTPPNCRPARCPAGMIGTPPNCRPARCPRGMVGTPPDCRPARCPRGMLGTPPDCRPARCPAGQVGTPPNCRPVQQLKPERSRPEQRRPFRERPRGEGPN
jgi:hypothetical protein